MGASRSRPDGGGGWPLTHGHPNLRCGLGVLQGPVGSEPRAHQVNHALQLAALAGMRCCFHAQRGRACRHSWQPRHGARWPVYERTRLGSDSGHPCEFHWARGRVGGSRQRAIAPHKTSDGLQSPLSDGPPRKAPLEPCRIRSKLYHLSAPNSNLLAGRQKILLKESCRLAFWAATPNRERKGPGHMVASSHRSATHRAAMMSLRSAR